MFSIRTTLTIVSSKLYKLTTRTLDLVRLSYTHGLIQSETKLDKRKIIIGNNHKVLRVYLHTQSHRFSYLKQYIWVDGDRLHLVTYIE